MPFSFIDLILYIILAIGNMKAIAINIKRYREQQMVFYTPFLNEYLLRDHL